MKVPNLYVLETLDSEKLAGVLQKECVKIDWNLNVMVQVLTTDEGEKQGIEPENVMNLVDYVITNCKNLNFIGLMSIGKIGDLDGFQMMNKLKIEI